MSTYVMPTLMWDDPATGAYEVEPEAPRQTVPVSSRDNAPVPHVAGAVRLAKVAETAGWATRQTYALVEVPATSRRAAHRLASVAVRLGRKPVRGYACWYQVDGGSWRYVMGYLAWRKLGLRELTAALREVTP